jgi:hypothetical protein
MNESQTEEDGFCPKCGGDTLNRAGGNTDWCKCQQAEETPRKPNPCVTIDSTLRWLESVRPGWGQLIRNKIAALEAENARLRSDLAKQQD